MPVFVQTILFFMLFLLSEFVIAYPVGVYGVYVGGGVSYQEKKSDDIRNISLRPRVLVGIGRPFAQWFYLGLEAYYDPKAINLRNNTVDGINLKSTYNYGLSLLPSVVLDPTVMPYLRLGIVTTHFNYPDVAKTGQEFGAGVDIRVLSCLSFRGEYDYVMYNKVSDIGNVRSPNNYYASLIYRFIL